MRASSIKFRSRHYGFVFAILLASCDNTQHPARPEETQEDPAIQGLASPIKLAPGKNILYLTDYFTQPENVESITSDPDIIISRLGDSLTIEAPIAGLNPVRILNFSVTDHTYSIPVFLTNAQEVTIHIPDTGHQWQDVRLKGEMNNWNPNAAILTFTEGFWTIHMFLPPGSYQYKLVADGTEFDDPTNEFQVSNGMGGTNSVLTVQNPSTEQKPQLQLAAYNESTISFSASQPTKPFAFWENDQIDVSDNGNGSYSIGIPSKSSHRKRSYIRVYAANGGGRSNDLLIPIEKGKVVHDVSQLDRTDYYQMVLYNAFVDRFYNGDTTNDYPNTPEIIHPKADYHGGDVLGVIAKMHEGYFDQLGVNGIWMSPLVQNVKGAYGYWPDPETKFSAYHGYWPISFTRMDKRLGTSVNLEELVDKAHHKGINIFLDFVANHVHIEHPLYKQHPEWATPLYLKDGTLNTERWDDHRLTTWFDKHMPSLKLYEPDVYNLLADSAAWWIRRYHVDGFRHDATKHVPHPFWRALTYRLKVQKGENPLYQIGETYGSRDLVGSYVNSGELDAQFDFNVYDDAVAVFAGNEDCKRLKEGLEKSLEAFGHHNLMGYISGNQDKARFVSYADGSVRFDEDAKAAGWTRQIEIQDSTALDKMALLMAFNMFIPGVPVIYYGDEIGMPGANDPDNRRMMKFENLTNGEVELKNTVASLIHFRRSHLSTIYGETKIIKAENGILCLERRYFDDVAILVINNSTKELTPDFLEAIAKMKPNFKNSTSRISPYSFEIYTLK